MYQLQASSTQDRLVYHSDKLNNVIALKKIITANDVDYYVFENPLQTPIMRTAALDAIREVERYSMPTDEIIKMLNDALQKINEGQNMQAHAIIYFLNQKISGELNYYKSALLQAMAVILTKDEAIEYFDVQSANDKLKTIINDKSLCGFFLNYLQKYNEIYTAIYNQITPNAL